MSSVRLTEAIPVSNRASLSPVFDDERVLIHHQLVGRQETIGHHLLDVGGRRTDEGGFRYADDQTIRHDRRFDVADVEAIKGRRLGL
jgi:hypothetical protein